MTRRSLAEAAAGPMASGHEMARLGNIRKPIGAVDGRGDLHDCLDHENRDIRWNFTKFLLGRDGKVLKRFEPGVKPDSAEMVEAIESALGGS